MSSTDSRLADGSPWFGLLPPNDPVASELPFVNFVHADADGLRLSPQPGQSPEPDSEYLSRVLGYLPPTRMVPRIKVRLSLERAEAENRYLDREAFRKRIEATLILLLSRIVL
ncbi:MAG: hypothetical protein ACKVW3_08200 [Phycisphaerales bacterium]